MAPSGSSALDSEVSVISQGPSVPFSLTTYTASRSQRDCSITERRRDTVAEQYEVLARVVSQKGTCALGHKVGDEFLIGHRTPAGMCSFAFDAVFPFAAVLQFGGSFPWENDSDKTTLACPDPDNPVVFELRRLRG